MARPLQGAGQSPHPQETPARRSRACLSWATIAVLYTVLTLVYFWPLPRLWQDHLGPYHTDPLFNLYVLKWGVHQIRLGLPDLWNANLFYPAKGTLAFSDHLIGPAAQLALFETVIPNAIAGYNFLFLSSFVASAFATCWVLRRSGLSWIASGLAGWMYAYSSFRLAQTPHLQMLIAQWIPLTLWFWDRLLAERTWKNAALFLLFYLLNLSGGCYLAYMIHFPLLAILACRAWAERRALLSRPSLGRLVPVALIAGAAVVLIFLPYVRVSRALGFTRAPSEISLYGATLASYLSPATENRYFGLEVQQRLQASPVRFVAPWGKALTRPENSLFAGFLPTLLFAAGVAIAWRRWRRRSPREGGEPGEPGDRDVWVLGLTVSGLVCFALTFASIYQPLMKVVPGLSGMRVAPRFYAFVSLTLVYYAARGIDGLLGRLRERPGGTRRGRAALAAGLAAGLALELAPRRLAWEPLPREEDLPPVYAWIRDEPAVQAVLELPIHAGPEENEYLYASTLHWKPIANGFSGFIPKLHDTLVARIRFLPRGLELERLRGVKISHLVLHTEILRRRAALRAWEKTFATGPDRQVERVYADAEHQVYRLLPVGERRGAPAPSAVDVPPRVSSP